MARATQRTVLLLVGLAAGAAVLFLVAANVFPDEVMTLYDASRGLISTAYEESRALISAATHTEEMIVGIDKVPLPTPPYRDEEAYSVLSTWIGEFAHGRRMTIQAETTMHRHSPSSDFVVCGGPLSCFPPQIRSEYARAFDDFTAQNCRTWILERRFDPNLKISLVSEPGLKTAVPKRRPPSKSALGGYFTVSAVGFIPDRTKAMFYVSQYDGGWGWGDYFLFKKQGTSWILVKTPCCSWIV
jgi:hypothetical protein